MTKKILKVDLSEKDIHVLINKKVKYMSSSFILRSGTKVGVYKTLRKSFTNQSMKTRGRLKYQ